MLMKKKPKPFDPFKETKSYTSHSKVEKSKEGKIDAKKSELRALQSEKVEKLPNSAYVIGLCYSFLYMVI